MGKTKELSFTRNVYQLFQKSNDRTIIRNAGRSSRSMRLEKLKGGTKLETLTKSLYFEEKKNTKKNTQNREKQRG